ncbi:hypothetical protein H4R34_001382 [Dimargaris verticillata]|uniref:Uncharacterized protein n=1 Tax=Dimargaris verticillata TaxID=2761393 RepID=A0A9W8EEJ0_9FUNG|nr:hypothetical protein H4R34_001382 [Dimargaris verticillata]
MKCVLTIGVIMHALWLCHAVRLNPEGPTSTAALGYGHYIQTDASDSLEAPSDGGGYLAPALLPWSTAHMTKDKQELVENAREALLQLAAHPHKVDRPISQVIECLYEPLTNAYVYYLQLLLQPNVNIIDYDITAYLTTDHGHDYYGVSAADIPSAPTIVRHGQIVQPLPPLRVSIVITVLSMLNIELGPNPVIHLTPKHVASFLDTEGQQGLVFVRTCGIKRQMEGYSRSSNRHTLVWDMVVYSPSFTGSVQFAPDVGVLLKKSSWRLSNHPLHAAVMHQVEQSRYAPHSPNSYGEEGSSTTGSTSSSTNPASNPRQSGHTHSHTLRAAHSRQKLSSAPTNQGALAAGQKPNVFLASLEHKPLPALPPRSPHQPLGTESKFIAENALYHTHPAFLEVEVLPETVNAQLQLLDMLGFGNLCAQPDIVTIFDRLGGYYSGSTFSKISYTEHHPGMQSCRYVVYRNAAGIIDYHSVLQNTITMLVAKTIGSPYNSNCVQGKDQASLVQGYSEFIALIMTLDPATSTAMVRRLESYTLHVFSSPKAAHTTGTSTADCSSSSSASQPPSLPHSLETSFHDLRHYRYYATASRSYPTSQGDHGPNAEESAEATEGDKLFHHGNRWFKILLRVYQLFAEELPHQPDVTIASQHMRSQFANTHVLDIVIASLKYLPCQPSVKNALDALMVVNYYTVQKHRNGELVGHVYPMAGLPFSV